MALLDNFSIQLFSLKDESEKDFAAVLKRVGSLGFTGVEFAGYHGFKAAELKALMNEYGIKSVGTHVGIDSIESDLDEIIAFNRVLGTKYIVIPYQHFTNEEETKAFAKRIKKAAPAIKEAGFAFGYHNHAHEFHKAGDKYLLDILMDELEGTDFILELDIYWAAYAGVDYISYLKANSNRIKMLHIKQMSDFESKACCDLDEGVIDFKILIETAKSLGIEEFILEQEEFKLDPWTSVDKGIKHIMSL